MIVKLFSKTYKIWVQYVDKSSYIFTVMCHDKHTQEKAWPTAWTPPNHSLERVYMQPYSHKRTACFHTSDTNTQASTVHPYT